MVGEQNSSFAKWIELVSLLALGTTFAILQFFPTPGLLRLLDSLLVLGLAGYVLTLFHFLLPRSRQNPRVILAALCINILAVVILDLFLGEYTLHLELTLIPLVMFAAWINGRETIQDMLAGAALEHRQRPDTERSVQRWEFFNRVGVKAQAQSHPDRILDVVGSELQTAGLDCIIARQDSGRQMRIVYNSLAPTLQGQLEKLLGVAGSEFRFALDTRWPFYSAIAERRALCFEPAGESLSLLLPHVDPIALAKLVQLLDVKRYILAPLFAHDQMVGVMAVWGRDLRSADAPVMTGLAQQLAVAMDKARLLEQEQKHSAQLVLVSDVASKVVGLLDPGELASEVARQLVQRFGFENSSIFLNDAARQEIVLKARAGSAINPQKIGYRQSWNTGLIGQAARTGKTVVANDVRANPDYYHMASPDQDVCRSELSIPLRRGYETLGVLDIQSTKLDAFDPLDIAAMETLASQIAVAVEKSELLAAEHKRANQLAMVSAIAEQATAILDSDQLLKEVVSLICERFGYYYVNVMTLEPRSGDLVMRAGAGAYADIFPPDYRQSTAIGLIGAAAQTRQIVVSNNTSQDARFYFPASNVPVAESEMCVPICLGNEFFGIFDIHRLEPNAFDSSDAAALEILANQIAIALENARLYARTKSEAEVKAALLRELSHRVKNNLTTIVGLLYLGLDDETIPREEILTETLTRVQSMVVAHTILAASPHARVDILELSNRVMSESIRQMTLPGRQIPFTLAGDPIEISAHQAASLALVLNELVTNSIKHGSDPGVKRFELSVRRKESQAQLEFFSAGDRLSSEPGSEIEAEGLGLKLIRTLVEKDLGGAFTLVPSSDPLGVLSLVTLEPEPE